MPYKFETEKTLIPKDRDKRIKLTDEDKKEIREMYATGHHSQRDLARMFRVSKRLIQFILNPEKQVDNYQRRVETGGSKQYYDKEKQRQYMRAYRQHKKELSEKGELIKKESEVKAWMK